MLVVGRAQGALADPAEKRLAVKVEDHPLEYGDFEGVIPEGNYGAGAMIVWDTRYLVPLKDRTQGLVEGQAPVRPHGYKLRGRWTLVKIKKAAKSVAPHQGAGRLRRDRR